MSALLESALDTARRSDCERTDCAPTQRPTLWINGQPSPVDALNDDDVYVIDLRAKRIVEHWRSSGLHAQTMKGGGSWWCPLGCALLTGLQTKMVLA